MIELLVKVLVGNKCDLAAWRDGESPPAGAIGIGSNTIKDFADQFDLKYIEASAKTRQNVDIAFQKLAELAIEKLIDWDS